MLPDRNASIPLPAKPRRKEPPKPTQELVQRQRGDKLPDRNHDKAVAVTTDRFKEAVKNHRSGLDTNPFRDAAADKPFESEWMTTDERMKKEREKNKQKGFNK
jgi:hypothetical protein